VIVGVDDWAFLTLEPWASSVLPCASISMRRSAIRR